MQRSIVKHLRNLLHLRNKLINNHSHSSQEHILNSIKSKSFFGNKHFLRFPNQSPKLDEIIFKLISKVPYPLANCLIALNVAIFVFYHLNSNSQKMRMKKYMTLTHNSPLASLLLAHFSHTNPITLGLDCVFLKMLLPMMERSLGPVNLVKAMFMGIALGTLLGRMSKKTKFSGNHAFLNTAVTFLLLQFGQFPLIFFPQLRVWMLVPLSMGISFLISEYVGFGGSLAGLFIYI